MHTAIINRFAKRKAATPGEPEDTNRLRYLAVLASNLRKSLPEPKGDQSSGPRQEREPIP
jgi:hypothetical protein